MFSTKRINNMWKLLLVVLFSGLAASTTAQDINISLSDTAAIAGETILVPLRISPIDEADAVISGTFKFNMNEAVFEIIGFDRTGTMLENTPNVFYNVGTNTLAFAGVDTLVGSGTLINLRVKAKDNAAYFSYTDVTFTEASLNEGDPTVNATGARLTIKGINIQPRSSNISILEGDSLQFTLSGNIVQPVTWSVTDTTIGTISSTGMFKAKTFGQVQVKAVDGQGLRDSTAFFRVQPAVLSELAVTIPDTSVRQTRDISLPIYISDVTGLEILSADLQVNYNQSYLTFNGVSSVGTMTENWGDPIVNTETGSIKIASAGTDTLAGFGTLYYLNFTVNDIGTGSFPINFVYANLNEDLSITLNNGTFTVLAKPVMELNQADTAISIGQTINFEVTGGNGTAPYTWEVDDTSIATIDQNSGQLTGISRGDVLVNAIDDQGFISELVNVRVNDFDAYLDSSTIIFPDTIEVALRTGDLTPFNVLSYEAEVAYDTTKLEFLDLVTIGTQSENASAEATVDDNLKVAAAGTSFLGGSDPVVILKFAQKDAIEHLDTLELDLLYLTFDEPGVDVPTASPLPGLLSVIKIDPPLAPVLVSPLDTSIDQDTSITFDWDPSFEADEYTLEVGTDDNFAGVVLDTTISETEFTLDGLDYLTFYYWRVKASNLGGESDWSDTLSFRTIIEKPEIPSLLFPVDSLDRAEITAFLSWNAADRADSYIIQLTTVEDFSTIDYEKVVFDTVTNQTGLSYLTDYYWRVKATNTGGESDYSEERTFQTKAIPAEVPFLELPADVSIDTDTVVTLSWLNANGAISYDYQLGTDDNFAGIVQEGNVGTDTSLAVVGLEYLTSYYWRVRTVGAQDTSDYSEPFSFTTKIQIPEVPILIDPANGEDRLPINPTLSWLSAERASEYTLQVSTDNGFSSIVVDSVTSDTSVALADLEFLTDYFWRVKASNSTGDSDYSTSQSFQTKAVDAAIPSLVSPIDMTIDTDTALTLIWNNAIGATSYEYQLGTDDNFAGIVQQGNVGSDTSLAVSGLDYLTSYYWSVRTVGAQDTSDYSEPFSFTTKIALPATPMLVSPADGVTEQPLSLDLVWNTAERAAEYKVEISAINDFSSLVLDQTVSDTTVLATGLTNLTDYFWRVKSINSTGESDYSEVRTFQTKAVDASVPSLISPTSGSVDTDTSLTITWSSAVGALEYEYEVSDVSDFSSISSTAIGSDTTALVNGLGYFTQYFWRARAIGAQDTSDWSGVFDFTTKIAKPDIPVLIDPANGEDRVPVSLTLSWNPADRATGYTIQLATDNSFSSIILDESTASTSLEVSGLDFLSDYFWRVKASNTTGESAYSAISSFQTKAVDASAPQLLSPIDGSTNTDTTVTLLWSTSTGALTYEYEFSNSLDFSSILSTGSSADTLAIISGLNYLTEYFWRVRGIGLQDTSIYSDASSFTTKIAAPEVPTLVSPENGETEQPLSLNLVWNTAERASEYKVEISASSDFSSFVLDQSVTDTTVLTTGLANLTDYFWRVKSINSTGESDYSISRSFQTKAVDATVPLLISPVSGTSATDTSVTILWSSATGALEYEYQLSNFNTFSSLVATGIGADTTALVSGLDYLTQYFWRARAIGAQDTSDWSGVFDFTTKIALPEAPSLLSPADATTQVPVNTTLLWNSAERAAGYSVQLSKVSTFDTVIIDSAITDTTLNLTGLDYLTDYFWRVKSTNSTGDSDYSSSRSFQTKAQDASVPTLLSPADFSVGVDTTANFVWSSSEGSLNYQFQLSTSSDFSTTINEVTGPDTTTGVSGLDFVSDYFWRVRGVGAQDTSVWSTPFSFTTRPDQLAAPILKSPGKGSLDLPDSVTFVWTSVPEADGYMFELDDDTSTVDLVSSITLSDTTTTIENLAFSTNFLWRVKSSDSNTSRESVWTPWFDFTTQQAPNLPPQVIDSLGTIILDEDFAEFEVAKLDTIFDDPDGLPMVFELVSAPDFVTSSLDENGVLTLQSVQDTSGVGELVVRATDDLGQTASDTLTIIIEAVNDLPFVIQLPDTIAFKQGDLFEFFIDTAFADVEDEVSELTFTTSVNPTDVFAVFDPVAFKISLTSPVYIGFADLTITVTDSDGGELQATIVLDVMPITSNEFNEGIPLQFSLDQNYPNPFNPSSTINFGIPEASDVRIDVYNMLGQHVGTLVDQKMQAGYHSVIFEASSLSSGTYIYRIVAGDFVQTKKMMLIK